jgi:hypothetical protein
MVRRDLEWVRTTCISCVNSSRMSLSVLAEVEGFYGSEVEGVVWGI